MAGQHRAVLRAKRFSCHYRRAHVLLRREAWEINGKPVYRLCKRDGSQLRRKAASEGETKRKPLRGALLQRCVGNGTGPRPVSDGSEAAVLTVEDTLSRYLSAVEPRFRLPRSRCERRAGARLRRGQLILPRSDSIWAANISPANYERCNARLRTR